MLHQLILPNIINLIRFPGLSPDWYMDDLLSLAHDLADRLLPAFDKTETGIPLPRVNLKTGVPEDGG